MMDITTGTTETTTTAGSRATMRAIVQKAYGTADQLVLGTLDRPSIAPDEVLVRIAAAGLDRGTWHLMSGEPYLIRLMGFGVRAPKNPVPGLDVAGTVVAIGNDVTRFAVGDAVFGVSKGSFAEYAAAREGKLAHKPESLTFDEAAVLGISGLTALKSVTDVARVEAGQHVLVIGASGGVGSFAVQIAVALGAHVTGVCSTAKAGLVTALGAERVIDYTTADFADGSEYDVVLDIGGSSSVSHLRRALAKDGTLVIVGGEGSSKWGTGMGRQLRAAALSPFVRQRLMMVVAEEHHSGLDRLAELVAAGQLTPALERTYPLEETADAMRDLVAGRARGKIAIHVADLG